MEEIVKIAETTNDESWGPWQFIPSHLSKGILASALSLAFAGIALREFTLVEKAEVKAFVFGV